MTSATNGTSRPAHPEPAAGPSRGRRARRLAAALLTVVTVVSGATTAAAGGTPAAAAQTASDAAELDRRSLQRSVDLLVARDGYPGVLAAVQDERGRVRNLTAGVGNLTTGQRVPRDGAVRIGSNTKTFTAVVVLQLVQEGLVELDEPVETYLPGLLRGEGIDGNQITVRQLLQHTSGLPNYTGILLADGLLPSLHAYRQPRGLLDVALTLPASFAPGTSWEYSNTNYVVAGLLVESVTERPIREEITERIIERLGLRETSFPNVGDETVPGPHPRAYHNDDPAQPLVDVTEQDPSFGWAAGQMIATPSDVNRFFTGLLDGRLLSPELMDQMRTTVPAPSLGEGAGYGLGLISTPLSCGETAWGHGGSITGYSTTNAATDDGGAVTIATTRLPSTAEQVASVQQVVDDVLCA